MNFSKAKYAVFVILFVVSSFLVLLDMYLQSKPVSAATATTYVTVSNDAPTFSVITAEQTASYGTNVGENPVNVGASLSFQATGTDANGDDYYLVLCRTNSVTPGDDAAPSCATAGDTFCTSPATTSGNVSSCSYTIQPTDVSESYAWYSFVCDKVVGGGQCSVVDQGSGNTGSPFYVNHNPSFTAIIDDGPRDPGGTVTFSALASDGDTEGVGNDNVRLVVCSDTSGATYAGCSGTQLCISSDSTSNPSCAYNIPNPAENVATNYYAYVFDSHQLGSGDNYRTSSFSINNIAPVVSNVVVNGSSTISLTENTTTPVNITGTVTDQNSCQDLDTVQAFMYMDPTKDYGVGTCDEALDADNNDCYAEVTCTVSGGTCSGNTDSSADFVCQVNMQFHANPTVTDGDATDASYSATDDWRATIKAVDSSFTAVLESPVGVEVDKTLGMSISPEIQYGNLSPGADTGTTTDADSNKTTLVQATGNVGMDLSFDGSLMCKDYPTCSGTTIPIANQQYHWSSSSFLYGTGTALTATGLEEEVNITKTTITANKAYKNVLWGISIPAVIDTGNYSGVNTITSYVGESADW